MIKQRRFFVFYGPTGVGKSDLALQFARAVGGEIINMDVGQFYVPFSIGTAKPEWRTSDVLHHFFDLFNNPVNMTVVDYRARLLPLMHDIWKRGKVPLLVGGSGFYLYSLLFPIQEAKLMSEECDSGKSYSWDDLCAIDPERAATIHKNDTYRIRQAMHTFFRTGILPSTAAPAYNPFAMHTIIFLERERQKLYERIHVRLEAMVAQGWIDEVRSVQGSAWERFLLEKKLIGYNELLEFISGGSKNLSVVLETIRQRTCRYAKRQMTFWRFLQKKIAAASINENQNQIVLNLSEKTEAEHIRSLMQRVRI